MTAWFWLAGVIAAIIAARVIVRLTLQTERISRWEVGALYRDGGFVRMLPPGEHTLLRRSKQRVDRIHTRSNYWPVGPVDATTKDGLPTRLSATAIYDIVDAEASLAVSIPSLMHLALTQGLLKLASLHDLETLRARDDVLGEELKAAVGAVHPAVEIVSTALGAIVLPPELRRMTTEVERARLEGLAQLERARGEQAALRSLANAARMLKDNPELMKLRLLQSVGAGKGATLVLGEAAIKPGAE